MATKKVWIITGWFSNYEELNYTDPSEEFYADSYAEAKVIHQQMIENPIYESVEISDEPEERDFY